MRGPNDLTALQVGDELFIPSGGWARSPGAIKPVIKLTRTEAHTRAERVRLKDGRIIGERYGWASRPTDDDRERITQYNLERKAEALWDRVRGMTRYAKADWLARFIAVNEPLLAEREAERAAAEAAR